MPDRPLRILHTISTLDPKRGSGPAQALARLACEQARQGLTVSIVTVDDPTGAERFVKPLETLGITVSCAGPAGRPLAWSPRSKPAIQAAVQRGIDIVHIHAIWEHLPHCAAGVARKAKIPYLVRPAGMLEPHALRDGRLKKRVHLFVRSGRDLRMAAAIHAMANQEARNIADLGLECPVLVVPNGVDLDEYSPAGPDPIVETRWPALEGKRRVLFMGRIDPIKGTMHLAEAWGRLWSKFPDWRLVVAGPDWRGHQAAFQTALAQHNALDSTAFVGAVYGAEKRALLASCDFMVQPSFQENFGITIAESLASARPVITTTGTPWHILQTKNAGWWIDIGVEPLYAAMLDAMSRRREDLDRMGLRGRRLMEEQFAWPTITGSLTSAYNWILGRTAKPDYVFLPGATIPK